MSSLQVAGVEGLILDLRNNPGGLLQSAVLASGMFVPRGNPLLIVEDRGRKHHQFCRSGVERADSFSDK